MAKIKNKKISVGVLAMAVLVAGFLASQAPKAEAAGEIYCSTSWAPSDPCISNAEDCFICSGFVSTCTVNAPDFNIFTVFVNNLANCSSGNEYCQTAKCPNDNASFSEGDSCTVRILDSGNVVASSNSHWDKSEGKCVQCNGNKQYSVCGSVAGLYLSPLGACVGASAFDNKLDFACNAAVVSQCDEKAVGDACNPPVGGTCSAAGLCVAAGALTVVANPNTIVVSTLSSVNFTVTAAAVAVSGATVSVSGSGVSGNCTTNASGQCAISVTATAVGNVNVTAAKAGYTDGTTTITVNPAAACVFGGAPFMVGFQSGSYNVGDTPKVNFAIPAGHNGCTELYKPDGSSSGWNRDDGSGLYSNTTTTAAGVAGVWKVTISDGVGSCSNSSTCFATTTVAAAGPTCAAGDGCLAGCVPADPDCSSTSACPSNRDACEAIVPSLALPCNCGTTPILAGESKYCCGATNGVFSGDAAGLAACQTACAAGPTCAAGDGCLAVGCVPPDPDCAACTVVGGACAINGDCCSNNCDTAAGVCAAAVPPRCNPNSWFYCNPLSSINTLSQAAETFLGYVLGLIGSVALLFIVIAGVMYMTSAGSEDRISTSKRILTGAVVGLGIALLAYSLLQVIVTILNA